MANHAKYTVEEMAEAIKQYKWKTNIARFLGCSISTVTNYIERHDELKVLYEENRTRIVDMAESSLVRLINQGHPSATIFALKTLGKNRGYIENPAINLEQNIHQYVVPVPAADMSDKEWLETYGNNGEKMIESGVIDAEVIEEEEDAE